MGQKQAHESWVAYILDKKVTNKHQKENPPIDQIKSNKHLLVRLKIY